MAKECCQNINTSYRNRVFTKEQIDILINNWDACVVAMKDYFDEKYK